MGHLCGRCTVMQICDFVSKFLEHDNNGLKYVVSFCKSNPMSCGGNSYRMLLMLKLSLQPRDYQYGMKYVVS